MKIYISKNNQTLGPYNEEQITQMIDAGSIILNDLCSLDGSTWQHVSEFIQIDEEPKSIPQKSLKPIPKPKNRGKDRKPSLHNPYEGESKKKENENPENSGSSSLKLTYFDRIREESLYPKLRSFLEIIFKINLAFGAFIILAGLALIKEWDLYSIFPIAGGFVIIFLTFAGKEMANLLIDVADSVIETNSSKK